MHRAAGPYTYVSPPRVDGGASRRNRLGPVLSLLRSSITLLSIRLLPVGNPYVLVSATGTFAAASESPYESTPMVFAFASDGMQTLVTDPFYAKAYKNLERSATKDALSAALRQTTPTPWRLIPPRLWPQDAQHIASLYAQAIGANQTDTANLVDKARNYLAFLLPTPPGSER